MRVEGSGFRVRGSGFRVRGFGFQGAGCRVQGSGLGVQVSGFRVRGSGFRDDGVLFGEMRVQGLGSMVQGFDRRVGVGFAVRVEGSGRPWGDERVWG